MSVNGFSKPWMLLISPIYPPAGSSYSAAFSSACVERLRLLFDTTSYQTILLKPNQTPETLSNNKKDIVIASDPADFCVKGDTNDTLIVWVRYRTGFNHSRLTIPYNNENRKKLPEMVSKQILITVMEEFLGKLILQGGPSGMEIKINDQISAIPPCEFYCPPGNYQLHSSFPGFQNRTDTLDIFPGKQYSKRILLLP
jgi:hypothetical protein